MWLKSTYQALKFLGIILVLFGVLVICEQGYHKFFGKSDKEYIFISHYKKANFYSMNQMTREYEPDGCLSESVTIKYSLDTLIIERPSLAIGYKPVSHNGGSVLLARNYAKQDAFFVKMSRTNNTPEIMYIFDGLRMVILCEKDSCVMFKKKI